MESFRRFQNYVVLFCIGAVCYGLLEVVWRGFTDPSMALAGGICFLLLGLINSTFSGRIPFWAMCIIGAVMITAVEYVFGVVLNMVLKMNVWDYSDMPMNLFGQICLPFTVLWAIVSGFGLKLDLFLKNRLFGYIPNKED
jgi:uncharacterized membrane protein